MRTVLFLVVLALMSCPRPRKAIAFDPRALDPCALNLSGTYQHATDPTWQYRGFDDGAGLTIWMSRNLDGGVATQDAGSIFVSLKRSDAGFLGEVHALGGLQNGTTCPVTFPVRVLHCSDAGIKLSAASETFINESCEIPSRSQHSVALEHELTRIAR
jgi:hypothetical protein